MGLGYREVAVRVGGLELGFGWVSGLARAPARKLEFGFRFGVPSRSLVGFLGSRTPNLGPHATQGYFIGTPIKGSTF